MVVALVATTQCVALRAQIYDVYRYLPPALQVLLVSATLPNEVLVIVGIVREFMRLERQLLNESPLARPSAALDLVKRGYMVKGPTGRLSLTPLGRMIQWRLAQLRAYQLGQEMPPAPADVEAFMSEEV